MADSGRRSSTWRNRYETSVADEKRRVREDDRATDGSTRVEAFSRVLLLLAAAAGGAVVMLSQDSAWLVVSGAVLLLLVVLAAAGLVLVRPWDER